MKIDICRLVQEMINNTLKHAKAKTISVKMVKVNSEIKLEFKDDGIGFNSNKDTEGIGLQSLRKKISQLNGKITLNSYPKKGTRIIVLIKV